ncbi:MAG: hypothetical protein NT011_06745 [Kiritimatiellaeota bacterium]|nr:hypothetical protein [Kiritimatiellota bacterium]
MTKALIHVLPANPMSGPEIERHLFAIIDAAAGRHGGSNLAVSVVHALCTAAEGRK